MLCIMHENSITTAQTIKTILLHNPVSSGNVIINVLPILWRHYRLVKSVELNKTLTVICFPFTVNGLLVITRGCTWKRQDDYYNNCPGSTNGPNEVTTYCETCENDGCNGASAIGKTLALLVVPLGLLLFK